MSNKQVCICLPSYKTMEPRMAFSVMALIDRERTAVMLDFGDAFISHSRNKLATNFLKTGIPWQLSFDDDMVFPHGDANLFNSFTGFNLPARFAGLNTIDRLLSANKSLVGGFYRGRWNGGKPVYGEGHEKDEADFVRRGPHDLVKPTRWVGTGCLLVHRSVYLSISEKYPHLHEKWYSPSEAVLRVAAEKATTLEEVKAALAVAKRTSVEAGEDVTFCLRATAAGHAPHVDLGLVCGHVGSFCYGYDATWGSSK